MRYEYETFFFKAYLQSGAKNQQLPSDQFIDFLNAKSALGWEYLGPMKFTTRVEPHWIPRFFGAKAKDVELIIPVFRREKFRGDR